MTGLYLALLVFSLTGTVLSDYRWKVALFSDARRTVLIIALTVVFFIAWDINGVANGVFFKGDNELLIGWNIWTEIPIEEVFFLSLLSHLALLSYRLWDRRR